MQWPQLYQGILTGDKKSLSRSISLVENEADGYEHLMELLSPRPQIIIIGITGPPGAGKSTLTDALIACLLTGNKQVGVLCVDPSSSFHQGALLGDRIRMSEWYNNPNVYIRSLATRGAVGGLSNKIVEITELLRAAPFDFIIIETVGVGQSEIEIAGLADTTVVVLVPEAGDDIQTMKAGLLEIADIFVVNKGDRPGADILLKNLHERVHEAPTGKVIPVLKTTATQKEGVAELMEAITSTQKNTTKEKRITLLTEKTFQLINRKRMEGVDKQQLKATITQHLSKGDFNLYKFYKQLV